MDHDTQALAELDGVSLHSGFPNPALDTIERQRPLALDLNQLLVRHPSSTYLFRISGHQWADQGVFDGDIAVIDRARPLQAGDLAIGWQDSGFVVYRWQRGLPRTVAHWGVISATIHIHEPQP